MKLLLDTSTFLWAIADPDLLSPRARDALSDPDNELFLSAASAWEIAIKVALGRIKISGPVEKLVPTEMAALSIEPLPVLHSHALRTIKLPPLHRDPFDRLLVAQTQVDHLTLVTSDRAIRSYAVPVVW